MAEETEHQNINNAPDPAAAAGDGETLPIIDFFADMPGIGDHVKDAYQKEQNRAGADAGDGEIEMPPESARGPANAGGFAEDIQRIMDPWDGGDAHPATPPAEVPILQPKEYYDNLDLKKIPELDTYEELATQNKFLQMEWYNLQQSSPASEVLGDDAADLSNIQKIYKPEAMPPNPAYAAESKEYKSTDTYEELEDSYKFKLQARDELLLEKYQSQQREALGDAAEDVGESLGGFVEGIPFIGDAFANPLTESEEANIEIHPPENDPGMIE